MEPKTKVVLVHGADGSSWSKVIPLLLEKGFNVTAAQLPLTSLDHDIAVTRNVSHPKEVADIIILAAASGGTKQLL